jgi:hypothetical protein
MRIFRAFASASPPSAGAYARALELAGKAADRAFLAGRLA